MSDAIVYDADEPKEDNSFTSETEHQAGLPIDEAFHSPAAESGCICTLSSSADDSSSRIGTNKSLQQYFDAVESDDGYYDYQYEYDHNYNYNYNYNNKCDDKCDDNIDDKCDDNDDDNDDDDNPKRHLPHQRSEALNDGSATDEKIEQQSQQSGEDTNTPAPSTRRIRSMNSVSFESSLGSGHNNQANIDSVDNHTKRSMDIRMDGNLLELRHTENGTNATTIIRPTSPATPVTPVTPETDNALSSPVIHSAATISWADSDEVLEYNDDDAETPRTGPEASSSNWNPTTSCYSPEDESDASNTTGTRFLLADRFRDLFNFRRMSLAIVEWMPFFWLSCFRHNQQLHGAAFSDRFILSRLNILSFFFAAGQLAASVWLCVVLFVDGAEEDFRHGFHLWNNNGTVAFIGCLGVVLLFTCFWTIRIVKEVDLVGALRFLWLLLWILPIAACLNVVAFDYHGVTNIWIIHYWNAAQLFYFRQRFCAPGTAEAECKVPINEARCEDEWCEKTHNATGCTEIRNEAQEETRVFLLYFYRILASWGCAYVFVIFLIIKCLERIVSKPMVQKSREVNVVGYLTFPVSCTALFGAINLYSPFSYLDKLNEQRWVAYLYLIASGLFFIALLMGWFISTFSIRNNTDKKNKSKAALILVGVLFLNLFVLLTIVVTSIIWSRDLMLPPDELATIACTVNNSECTNCDGGATDKKRCPEWSVDDVKGIVRRQLKQSAILASTIIWYNMNVMRHGLRLRKHLSMYQIDYV
eukprot:CAMPEP_0172379456 /NCGR_PEP_ID=MMETSP1060-20121228/69943_1 /TAXON_ID=37318 /ORGANISM="Pseudo-nitzschia pungens, Strain cf. cingulata" /LENGTH=755 /DNA_ID=CAMNT_0013107197 /DNA_START=33 /DNA_END=2300 /DNA_ORIENTATION=+